MQNFGLRIFNFWTAQFSVWTWPHLPPAPLSPPPTVTGEVTRQPIGLGLGLGLGIGLGLVVGLRIGLGLGL